MLLSLDLYRMFLCNNCRHTYDKISILKMLSPIYYCVLEFVAALNRLTSYKMYKDMLLLLFFSGKIIHK